MSESKMSRLRRVGIVVVVFGVVWSALYLVLMSNAIPIPADPAWAILTTMAGMFVSLTVLLYLIGPYLAGENRTDAAQQVREAIGNWPGAMGVGWIFIGIGTLPFLSSMLRVAIVICGIAFVIVSFKKLDERVRARFQKK